MLSSLLLIYFLKFLIVKRKPWLNKFYRNCKIVHITVLQTLIEIKLVFELFCSYGILNYYKGIFDTTTIKIDPILPVHFLDDLGYQRGGKGFVFILLLVVLKVKLSLNMVESSWGYLQNLNRSITSSQSETREGGPAQLSSEDVLNKKNLLILYYLTVRYINMELKLKRGIIKTMSRDCKEIELLLVGMYLNHAKSCRNTRCYCKQERKLR